MTGERNETEREAALWRRTRVAWTASGPGAEPPDLTMLAAYLDGTLDPEGEAPVEAWLAGSPEGLDLVLAARAAQDGATMAVPQRVLSRARALVRAGPPAASAGRGAGARAQGGLGRWLQPAAWVGIAAAVLLASVSGFELGRAGVQHLVSLDAAMADDLRLLTGRSAEDLL